MYFCVIRQESEWTKKNSTVENRDIVENIIIIFLRTNKNFSWNFFYRMSGQIDLGRSIGCHGSEYSKSGPTAELSALLYQIQNSHSAPVPNCQTKINISLSQRHTVTPAVPQR